MVAKMIIGLGFAFLLVAQVLASNCPTCGMTSGTDMCGCSAHVVRPVKLNRIQPISTPRIVCTKVPGVEKFKPVGDICSACSGSQIIAPAIVPKQRCSSCGRYQEQQYDSLPYAYGGSGGYSSSLMPAPAQLNDFGPEDSGNVYDSFGTGSGSSGNYINEQIYDNYYSPQQPLAPADAVSLTLAYGLQQQAAKSVPEERLAFGFRQIPKDSPIQKQTTDIPEERLFTVDRQIVELKAAPKPYNLAAALEQEAAEDLLAQQQDELELQDEAVQSGQSYLSYKDIGYGPETVRNQPKFIINNGYSEQTNNYDNYGSYSGQSCNDGFIPGRVIQQDFTTDAYLEENTSGAYGSEEDDYTQPQYNIVSGSQGGYYGPNSYSGSRTNSMFTSKLIGGGSGYGYGSNFASGYESGTGAGYGTGYGSGYGSYSGNYGSSYGSSCGGSR